MSIEKALGKMASFEEKYPKTTIAIFVVFTLIIMGGFAQLTSEQNFENFVPQDIEVITAINEIRDKFGTTTETMIIIFRIDPSDPNYIRDIRDKEILEAMDRIIVQIEDDDFVVSSTSILDVVKENGRLPDQRVINAKLNETINNQLNEDFTLMVVRFQVAAGLSQAQQEQLVNMVFKTIQFTDKPLGVEIVPAGDIVLNIELPKVIGSSTGLVTLYGFIGVFIVLLAIFRRIFIAAVPMIPIIFGILWTFGTLGFVGIPLSTALVGIFSMIIGLGIDFGIHIVHRFEEEAEKFPVKEAIHGSVVHVGKGLVLTSITTIIGFLALLSATLPILKDMAIALSFGVLYALIASIGLIPPILVLIERRRQRKKKR